MEQARACCGHRLWPQCGHRLRSAGTAADNIAIELASAPSLLYPQVAAFQCLQPFIGTLLAFLVLRERPSAWDLGALPIVAGLVLVSTDRKDLVRASKRRPRLCLGVA